MLYSVVQNSIVCLVIRRAFILIKSITEYTGISLTIEICKGLWVISHSEHRASYICKTPICDTWLAYQNLNSKPKVYYHVLYDLDTYHQGSILQVNKQTLKWRGNLRWHLCCSHATKVRERITIPQITQLEVIARCSIIPDTALQLVTPLYKRHSCSEVSRNIACWETSFYSIRCYDE